MPSFFAHRETFNHKNINAFIAGCERSSALVLGLYDFWSHPLEQQMKLVLSLCNAETRIYIFF